MADSRDATPLPEDHNGVAAQFPGDAGIETHPSVIFVERFDGDSVEAIGDRWDNVGNPDTLSISVDTPPDSADGQSLLMTHVGGENTGGHLYRRLPPGLTSVFARFYVKFHPDSAQIHHFGTHLGGYNPPTPWPQGGAGIKPNGDERFTTQIEPHSPWKWAFYTYWRGMRAHGDGGYWGTPFMQGVERPDVERGQWVSVELMVKLNEPVTASNGEQAFWIDGKLWRADGQIVSHVGPGFPKGKWTGGWWSPDANADTAFEGYQWRTVKELTVNELWAYVYITKAPKGHVTKVWFDNIVVASEYIGPMTPVR